MSVTPRLRRRFRLLGRVGRGRARLGSAPTAGVPDGVVGGRWETSGDF